MGTQDDEIVYPKSAQPVDCDRRDSVAAPQPVRMWRVADAGQDVLVKNAPTAVARRWRDDGATLLSICDTLDRSLDLKVIVRINDHANGSYSR